MDKKVVLIVEDDPKNMKLTADYLEMLGYANIQAWDGQQGVESAKKHKPALILMDIMMPKMDGYTACHAIKQAEETRMIPVVMLTAVGYELNKILAKQMGCDGYLTKPFSCQELKDTISPFLAVS
jgi:DNA-binding response OmpR family regulator